MVPVLGCLPIMSCPVNHPRNPPYFNEACFYGWEEGEQEEKDPIPMDTDCTLYGLLTLQRPLNSKLQVTEVTWLRMWVLVVLAEDESGFSDLLSTLAAQSMNVSKHCFLH